MAKYTKEMCEEMIKVKETEGKSIKKQCVEKWGVNEKGQCKEYQGVHKAMETFGLKIPKKFAEVKRNHEKLVTV